MLDLSLAPASSLSGLWLCSYAGRTSGLLAALEALASCPKICLLTIQSMLPPLLPTRWCCLLPVSCLSCVLRRTWGRWRGLRGLCVRETGTEPPEEGEAPHSLVWHEECQFCSFTAGEAGGRVCAFRVLCVCTCMYMYVCACIFTCVRVCTRMCGCACVRFLVCGEMGAAWPSTFRPGPVVWAGL
jgi:hypothetical protein